MHSHNVFIFELAGCLVLAICSSHLAWVSPALHIHHHNEADNSMKLGILLVLMINAVISKLQAVFLLVKQSVNHHLKCHGDLILR